MGDNTMLISILATICVGVAAAGTYYYISPNETENASSTYDEQMYYGRKIGGNKSKHNRKYNRNKKSKKRIL